jgi:hypothetical protein
MPLARPLIRPIRWHIAVVCVVGLGLCSAGSVCAQSERTPSGRAGSASFEWFDLSVGGLKSIHSVGFEGWTLGPAAVVNASGPFHGGRAGLSVSVRSLGSDTDDLPSFTGILAAPGYALDIAMSDRISILPGIRAGDFLMIFDTTELANQRVESEFAVEPHLTVRIGIRGRAACFVEAAWLRVFTMPRLDEAGVRAGIAMRFTTPSRLRRWLR